jgi:hypothetical protein
MVTNPLDVVRTQATMRTWAVDSASTSLSLLPRIFAEQGVRGLMAGTLARASYMGPFPPPLHRSLAIPLSSTLSLHPSLHPSLSTPSFNPSCSHGLPLSLPSSLCPSISSLSLFLSLSSLPLSLLPSSSLPLSLPLHVACYCHFWLHADLV